MTAFEHSAGAQVAPFRYFTQKVLPTVYDDSLSYLELLQKMEKYLNDVISAVNDNSDSVAELQAAYTSFTAVINETVQSYKDYMDNYFNNLDVQQEIDNKLDSMVLDGTFSTLLQPIITELAPTIIDNWLDAHPEATTTVEDGSITTAKLANNSVTTPKIVDNSVTNDKLDEKGVLSDVLNLEQYFAGSYEWEDGYCNIWGNIITTGAANRYHTKPVPCIPGQTIKYKSETDSANVTGIGFYKTNEQLNASTFVSGVANAGSVDEEHTVIVPNNAKYFILSGNTTKLPLEACYARMEDTTLLYELWENTIELQNENSVMFVSANGNDNNDGLSSATPLATVNKALELGANDIRMLEGVYEQQIDVSKCKSGMLSISNYTNNGKVVITDNNRVITTTETLVAGSSKVYSCTTDKTFSAIMNWIYQDGVPDTRTLISDSERHPLERGMEYRCDDTVIEKCSSDNLSDALSEMEASNDYLWYKDGTTLYYTRPQTVNSSNPICMSSGKGLFANVTRRNNIKLSGIDCKYMYFNFESFANIVISDCRVSNTFAMDGFSYHKVLSALFIRCEACRTQQNIYGDGFGAHSDETGNPHSKQTNATFIDCWSHDNNDDGFSNHGRGEDTIIGGLYEYNKKGGVTPSYGDHCTCYNVISRNNHRGFYYTGTATTAEGGKYGQMLCVNCLAENNTGAASSSGFIVDGTENSAILINCISINNKYGYNFNGISGNIRMIDCRAKNNTQTLIGTSNITIDNTELVTI